MISFTVPDVETSVTDALEEGAAMIKRTGCDVIVGAGGGKILDMCKLLAIISGQQSVEGSIEDYAEEHAASMLAADMGSGGSLASLTQSPKPLITVPTGGCTGAEISSRAYAMCEGKRMTFSDPVQQERIAPDACVVDPELCAGRVEDGAVVLMRCIDAATHKNDDNHLYSSLIEAISNPAFAIGSLGPSSSDEALAHWRRAALLCGRVANRDGFGLLHAFCTVMTNKISHVSYADVALAVLPTWCKRQQSSTAHAMEGIVDGDVLSHVSRHLSSAHTDSSWTTLRDQCDHFSESIIVDAVCEVMTRRHSDFRVYQDLGVDNVGLSECIVSYLESPVPSP